MARIIRILQKTFAPAHHNPSKCITARSKDWGSAYELVKLESLNYFKVTLLFFCRETLLIL